jgi:hypothetical protein
MLLSKTGKNELLWGEGSEGGYEWNFGDTKLKVSMERTKNWVYRAEKNYR